MPKLPCLPHLLMCKSHCLAWKRRAEWERKCGECPTLLYCSAPTFHFQSCNWEEEEEEQWKEVLLSLPPSLLPVATTSVCLLKGSAQRIRSSRLKKKTSHFSTPIQIPHLKDTLANLNLKQVRSLHASACSELVMVWCGSSIPTQFLHILYVLL